MTLSNSSNFERIGNTENDLLLENAEQISSAVISLSARALRTIKIFSPDLEHHLYNNNKFRESLLTFARGNRHASIQILVADITPCLNKGHSLIQLAQQLTSSMQIRITPKEYVDTKVSYIVIDHSSFLFKADSTRTHALRSTCQYRSKTLNETFTLAWEQADPASEIKRLRI